MILFFFCRGQLEAMQTFVTDSVLGRYFPAWNSLLAAEGTGFLVGNEVFLFIFCSHFLSLCFDSLIFFSYIYSFLSLFAFYML